MDIFGWLMLVAISCYATFGFIAGSVLSIGFSGKSMGAIANVVGLSVILCLWYLTVSNFPFEVAVK